MGKKVLSIDISDSFIKVCEVDYKAKNTKIYNAFTIMTPDGAFQDGEALETESFGAYLKQNLRSHGVKTKQVVYTVNSARIANREVTIPFVKEKQIQTIVETNASDYFPVDITGYQLAYNILETVENAGTKQYRLLVLAVPKNILESYYELSKSAGLSIVALDYSGNSVIPAVKTVLTDEPTMIIKIDEQSVQLTVMKNKAMALQRNINNGVNVAFDTMFELPAFGDGLTVEQALYNFRTKPCFFTSFMDDGSTDEDGDSMMAAAKLEVTDSLRSMILSIVRVIDYYNSRNTEEPITTYLLTGLAADFVGLAKLLTSEMDGEEPKVSILSKVNGVNLDKSVKEVSFGEYIACIGAAMAPIDLIPEERDPKKQKKKKSSGGGLSSEVDMMVVCAIIMVVGLIAAGGMFAYSFINYNNANNENKRLKTRKEELQPIIVIHDDYSRASQLYTDVVAMYDMTQNPNENIVAFLNELQDKMPTSIAVSSFSSSKESVAMSMNVSTKEAVGKVIEQFRTFESIKEISFSGASSTMDGAGEEVWSFSINATYADMPSIAASDEEEGAADAAGTEASDTEEAAE